MQNTALITSEKKYESPILVIDKKGILGESIINELKSQSPVFFVTKKVTQQEDKIIYISFSGKKPKIPDNIYSHIFLIDEDLEFIKNTSKAFVKKAKKDNSYLILVVDRNFADEEYIKKELSLYENIKVIIAGDIFSKNEIFNYKSYISKYIYQAKITGRIEVPGDGAKETYPVFFDDVISGILEAVFLENTHKIYYLFPKFKVNLLMLAHMFQKKDPNLKIIFVREKKETKKTFIASQDGKFLLGESYDLLEKIKKIDFTALNINSEYIKKSFKESFEERIIRLNYSLILLFFIFFLCLPLIATLLFSFMGTGSLYFIKNSFERSNINISKPAAIFAKQNFELAQKSTDLLKEEARIIGQEEKVEDLRKKINLGIEVSSGIVSVVTALEKIKLIANGLSKNPSDDFYEAQTEIKNALYIYSKQKELGIIPDSIKTKLGNVVNFASSTIDFWPDIFGFNGQKTYLILFQNNTELRPGGGFIGSYGIISLMNGEITNFKIYDVYDADGQLRTHVEPPFAIRRYLPSVNWYLRDSNFNVDFSKGAVASAIFLNSEMHQVVDGVIGVDLFFIKGLLLTFGPVYVSDYKETINVDNFYQITQGHIEKDFFPGSTQKKDFLRSFYNSIQEKILTSKNIPYFNLLNLLINTTQEKHILFAFNDPTQQATFALNGWSSALSDKREKEKDVINDFLGINEANLGANKINYYITRSVSQNITISDEGLVSEKLTIALKNTSQKAGDYKSYLRIILPENTSLNKIIINEKEQKIVNAITDPSVYEKKNFTPPQGLEVEKEKQAQNTIYGFLVNIGPQELKTIQLEYDLPEKLVISKPEFKYSLKLFKQPGIDFYPYDFTLSYPPSFKAINVFKNAKTSSDKVIFSSQINKDIELKINFAAK